MYLVFINVKLKNSFLSVVRQGIGHSSEPIEEISDWKALKALADEHGLSAVVLDGLEKVNMNQPRLMKSMTQGMRLGWIGEVLQNYESRYAVYENAIASLAGFYRQHGINMMVLKGYACSLDWPKPNHLPCGDIDIWQFGKHKEADEALARQMGIQVDTSHHKHTTFNWHGITVENHYDFVNIHSHKSNRDLENIFEDLGKDDTHYIEVGGEKVFLPSANLHALFLIRHMSGHFAAERITLRQVLDWAFFVEKHSEEINWEWLEGILEEFGMKKLYDVLNAICVGDLGFDVNIFNRVQFDPSIKDRVVNEILSPEFSIEPPSGLFKRIIFKLRRWKGNEWKHQLCYKDSMWSAFWSGVWNHLLKPSSI